MKEYLLEEKLQKSLRAPYEVQIVLEWYGLQLNWKYAIFWNAVCSR
jgi:hypothetical protein